MLPTMRLGVAFTPLKAKIFDAIARATPSGGIYSRDLLELIYPDKPVTDGTRRTLRAHISQINDMLLGVDHYIAAGQRCQPYRLMRRNIKETG